MSRAGSLQPCSTTGASEVQVEIGFTEVVSRSGEVDTGRVNAHGWARVLVMM